MGERALKWAFKLLGIALVVVPLVVALAAADWDLKAAVLPSNEELNQAKSAVAGVIGGGISQDTLTWGSPTIVDSNLSVPVTLKSPFNVPIKITEAAVTANTGTQTIQLRMKEKEVEVPKNATVVITLVGTYSGMLPSNPQIAGFMTIEVYGLTARIQVGGG